MTALEMFSMLTSSGVFAGGLGLLRWGLTTERRITVLEIKNGIKA